VTARRISRWKGHHSTGWSRQQLTGGTGAGGAGLPVRVPGAVRHGRTRAEGAAGGGGLSARTTMPARMPAVPAAAFGLAGPVAMSWAGGLPSLNSRRRSRQSVAGLLASPSHRVPAKSATHASRPRDRRHPCRHRHRFYAWHSRTASPPPLGTAPRSRGSARRSKRRPCSASRRG